MLGEEVPRAGDPGFSGEGVYRKSWSCRMDSLGKGMTPRAWGSNAEILGMLNQETRLRASVDNLDRNNSPFWRARLILFNFLNWHFIVKAIICAKHVAPCS